MLCPLTLCPPRCSERSGTRLEHSHTHLVSCCSYSLSYPTNLFLPSFWAHFPLFPFPFPLFKSVPLGACNPSTFTPQLLRPKRKCARRGNISEPRASLCARRLGSCRYPCPSLPLWLATPDGVTGECRLHHARHACFIRRFPASKNRPQPKATSRPFGSAAARASHCSRDFPCARSLGICCSRCPGCPCARPIRHLRPSARSFRHLRRLSLARSAFVQRWWRRDSSTRSKRAWPCARSLGICCSRCPRCPSARSIRHPRPSNRSFRHLRRFSLARSAFVQRWWRRDSSTRSKRAWPCARSLGICCSRCPRCPSARSIRHLRPT